MDYLFKYEVNRRLSGKPHLRPVFNDVHDIAERIRDIDPTLVWEAITKVEVDFSPVPLVCGEKIVLNFSAAGEAWILYR